MKLKKHLPIVLFFMVLAGLLRLGFWQLDRAEEKRLLIFNQQQRAQQSAQPLNDSATMTDDMRYRKVTLTGRYWPQRQFLINNQFYKGQLGYFVMTPFARLNSDTLVLVNRGWVSVTDNDFNSALPSGDAVVTIRGVINYFPSVGLILKGADEPSAHWPSAVQIINPEKITKKLGHAIADFQVQLSPDETHGYIRQWHINTRMPPEKHTAYAFQWFSLAATLTFLMIWMAFKTKKI